MIKLDAEISSNRLPSTFTWDSVPEWALRYDCFLGDVRFSIGKVDFSTQWGWVPVLDFALAISNLLDSLEPGSSRDLEFTESEASIRFTRVNDVVAVTSTYSPGSASVDVHEIRAVARDFVQRLGFRLSEEHPALKENTEFLDALRRAGVA